MLTAILVTGRPDPTALRVSPIDRTPIITDGSGPLVKNFKFHSEKGDVLIYRGLNDGIPDKDFERLAAQEADKFLNPQKYKRMGTPQDDSARTIEALQAEVEAYRAKHGPLKKEN